MSDIVERLIKEGVWKDAFTNEYKVDPLCREAADEIESLRQRVKELERTNEILRDALSDSDKTETEFMHRAQEAEAELAALKQLQGEPVAYQFQDRDGKWHSFNGPKHYEATVADGSWPIRALYTSAPTIPEGWQIVPIEPLHKLLEYAEESNSARYGTLSTSLVRDLVEEALAAAPKLEDVK